MKVHRALPSKCSCIEQQNKHVLTSCLAAENTGLSLMKAAVVNFLAHLLVLDSNLDLSRHCLAGQANHTTWQSVAKRASTLQTAAQKPPGMTS